MSLIVELRRVKKQMLDEEAIYQFGSTESSQVLKKPEVPEEDDLEPRQAASTTVSTPQDSDSETSRKPRGRRRKYKRQGTPELETAPIEKLDVEEPPVIGVEEPEDAAPMEQQPSKKEKRRAKEAAKKSAGALPSQEVSFQLY
jgi:hypothetical protein